MCSNYPGNKLEQALRTRGDKIEHFFIVCSHRPHNCKTGHFTSQKERERLQNEECTCKACKNTVFHCQICKFVGFLLPSSSCLLKLPITSKTCCVSQWIVIYPFEQLAPQKYDKKYEINKRRKVRMVGCQ